MVIREEAPKKALENDVSRTWFGTAGLDAIFMSKSHTVTAEAKHKGPKEMQCTPKEYSVQTPKHRLKLLENDHPGGGSKKAIQNHKSITWFGTVGRDPLSCPNLKWPHSRRPT